MGEQNYGKCDVCGKEGPLERTYFYYGIKCECHSPNHFELINHCRDCAPKEPKYSMVEFKTEDLKNPVAIAMRILTEALSRDKDPGSYYYSWQSNIACEIMDNSGLDHEAANKIAIKFLERLIK